MNTCDNMIASYPMTERIANWRAFIAQLRAQGIEVWALPVPDATLAPLDVDWFELDGAIIVRSSRWMGRVFAPKMVA